MDRLTPERRTLNMRAIRSTGMKPEMLVRRMAHALGYRFRLHRRDLPGNPDLVFPGRRKLIFVHGCFWHQHRGCSTGHLPKTNTKYWLPKLARNVARDAKNIATLRRSGWHVLVIWECEAKDSDYLRQRLLRFL